MVSTIPPFLWAQRLVSPVTSAAPFMLPMLTIRTMVGPLERLTLVLGATLLVTTLCRVLVVLLLAPRFPLRIWLCSPLIRCMVILLFILVRTSRLLRLLHTLLLTMSLARAPRTPF